MCPGGKIDEMNLVFLLMCIFGKEHIFGGPYSKAKEGAEQIICHIEDRCFKCREIGHISVECAKSKEKSSQTMHSKLPVEDAILVISNLYKFLNYEYLEFENVGLLEVVYLFVIELC